MLKKYRNYTTFDEKEISLMQKFKERLLQILSFFKSKAANPNVIGGVEAKVESELAVLLTSQPLHLG